MHHADYLQPDERSVTMTISTTIHHTNVSVNEQQMIAHQMKKNNAILLTEWVASNEDKTTQWYVLYLSRENGLQCIESTLHYKRPHIVDLSHVFPVCHRLQRAIREFTRIPTKKAKDKRLWLNHGYFPLGILSDKQKKISNYSYSFKPVLGDAVHEIGVGPVHAGIIEPGHFRFSVVGERVLKLETQLGYTHKGIHQLLKGQSIANAAKIIGRVSGDSSVAYAIAFAQACEQTQSFTPTLHVRIERAIFLERERIANHLGDLGAIINDTGFPSLHALFQIQKEILLRNNLKIVGHRYAIDCIKPFETNALIQYGDEACIIDELNDLEKQLIALKHIVDSNHGLQDRLESTGIISTSLAQSLGLLGLASKASGINIDCRSIFADELYGKQAIDTDDIKTGDVLARVQVRFKECFDSIALIRSWIGLLKNASQKNKELSSFNNGMGIGVVEGWRGPITVAVSIKDNHVAWCHFHEPSWQNWQAIDHAVMDNIVADFPLINKSFNLSYSGQDC